MVGTTIGKYRVTALLGRGATGVVYKAIDATLNREVAMKVLRSDAADEDARHRFRTEAAILARLQHPEIATIYELVETDTNLVMVMELVAGESLEALAARSGRLPVDSATYLIDRVLAALEHAHRAGIVHRDLKPANVMVTAVGGIKVMDFGIARISAGERITLHGSMMGTPGYMAPEQILGQAVDARADVYAVGAMLYRLLGGVMPFVADTPVAVIQRQLAEPLPPLRIHVPEIPEAYEEIVARAMAKAPEERYPSADAFREAIGHVSGTSKAIDVAKRFAQAAPETPAAIGTAEATPAPAVPAETLVLPGRRSWRTLTTAALIVVAITAAGIAIGRRSRAHEAPPSAAPAAPPSAPLPPPSQVVASAPDPDSAHAADAAAPPPAASSPAVVQPVAAPPAPAPAAQPRPATAPAAPVVVATSAPPLASDEHADADRPAEPVLVFDTKFLAMVDAKPRELDARLVVADHGLTLMPADEGGDPLQVLAYEKLASISYSVSRDPMWKSPRGPALVVRRSGPLRLLGISIPRHWIALRTQANTFVVLRMNELSAPAVLSALEKRTGIHPQRLTDGSRRMRE